VHTELYALVQRSFERKEPDKIDAQRQRIESLRDLPEPSTAHEVLDVARPAEPAEPALAAVAAPARRPSKKPIRPNGHPVDILNDRQRHEQPVAAPPRPVASGPVASGPVASGPVASGPVASGPDVGELVRKVLGGTPPQEIPASQRPLFDSLRQWIESEKVKTAEEQASQIKILERRISKLSDALTETESELGRVIQMKVVDPGVASAFRHVQGLSAEDANYEAKRAIMEEIFKANLKLASRGD
jgi:hypothetical protein